MLSLRSPDLLAELLDPADPSERALQGSRYAWGGYVWQVRDARSGAALLSGPEWPETRPDPFNGQGLPESFRHAAWPDQKPLTVFEGRGFVLGAGEVEPGPGNSPIVSRPCSWDVGGDASRLDFSTRQAALGWACRIGRSVTLAGRTLVSASVVENTGDKPLPLHWFAHPFFALAQGMLTCALPEAYGCAENPGFVVGPGNRLAFRRRFSGLRDGHFELLTMRERTPLRAVVSHPSGRDIVFSTDFAPDLCPVWGNGNTWSIEPYLMTTLAPGETRGWSLRYEF